MLSTVNKDIVNYMLPRFNQRYSENHLFIHSECFKRGQILNYKINGAKVAFELKWIVVHIGMCSLRIFPRKGGGIKFLGQSASACNFFAPTEHF